MTKVKYEDRVGAIKTFNKYINNAVHLRQLTIILDNLMLNKNTWVVKKCEANQKQRC